MADDLFYLTLRAHSGARCSRSARCSCSLEAATASAIACRLCGSLERAAYSPSTYGGLERQRRRALCLRGPLHFRASVCCSPGKAEWGWRRRKDAAAPVQTRGYSATLFRGRAGGRTLFCRACLGITWPAALTSACDVQRVFAAFLLAWRSSAPGAILPPATLRTAPCLLDGWLAEGPGDGGRLALSLRAPALDGSAARKT